MSNEFITTEDYINANRSPPLQPAQPNYRSSDTPPPLEDPDDNDYHPDVTGTRGGGEHVLRFRSSKGPDYPEVAIKASRESLTLSPKSACEDRRPSTAATRDRMLSEAVRRGLSSTADEHLARAAFEASEKLNAALHHNGRAVSAASFLQSSTAKQTSSIHVHEIEPETVELLSGVRRTSLETRYIMAHHPSSGLSSPQPLNVRPPPKVSLPAVRTKSPVLRSDWPAGAKETMATSPALAKFTITPADGNPQQMLPKMQTPPSRPIRGLSPGRNQTLPSLETALGQIADSEGASYSAHSASAISRPSPAQYSQFGPSPSSYSTQSPASAISPPRLPTNPSYWRTSGHETSNSTPSDQASNVPSAGISTPASSYFGHSPSNSGSTPATIVPEPESSSNFSGASTGLAEASTPYTSVYAGSAPSTSPAAIVDGANQYNGDYGNGSFKCTFHGCNAPSFQTQYLLNSHANVHSNTRPHFCPVQGCPRGPGGQGFKRKNEMIRHGLVHQSPGYVCPFCPDQQHKYPRPDNLQRHVRVHHVDRDRDDPMLRDILAQRLEGGNRGRRRRLGS